MDLEKFSAARVLRGESYILVSEAYNPTHPLVLDGARGLVNVLIFLNDYFDAERYVRIAYECLIEISVDTENCAKDVEESALLLGKVTHCILKQQ